MVLTLESDSAQEWRFECCCHRRFLLLFLLLSVRHHGLWRRGWHYHLLFLLCRWRWSWDVEAVSDERWSRRGLADWRRAVLLFLLFLLEQTAVLGKNWKIRRR